MGAFEKCFWAHSNCGVWVQAFSRSSAFKLHELEVQWLSSRYCTFEVQQLSSRNCIFGSTCGHRRGAAGGILVRCWRLLRDVRSARHAVCWRVRRLRQHMVMLRAAAAFKSALSLPPCFPCFPYFPSPRTPLFGQHILRWLATFCFLALLAATMLNPVWMLSSVWMLRQVWMWGRCFTLPLKLMAAHHEKMRGRERK